LDNSKTKNLKYSNIKYILIITGIILGGIPIVLYFSDWYYGVQIEKFGLGDELLFIHDNLSLIIIVFAPMTLGYLTLLRITDKKPKKIYNINIYSLIIIILIVVCSIILVVQFVNYSVAKPDGISIRKGLFDEEDHYEWNEVNNVYITYGISIKNKVSIYYLINLEDGTEINAYNSKYFFNSIVKLDKFINDKGIPIHRAKVIEDDYETFKYKFQGKGRTNVDRFKVMEQIFNMTNR